VSITAEAQGAEARGAEARGAGAARFAVHAIVRTNAKAEGRRYEMLAYERLPDDGL
jgi:hypothetical protein